MYSDSTQNCTRRTVSSGISADPHRSGNNIHSEQFNHNQRNHGYSNQDILSSQRYLTSDAEYHQNYRSEKYGACYDDPQHNQVQSARHRDYNDGLEDHFLGRDIRPHDPGGSSFAPVIKKP